MLISSFKLYEDEKFHAERCWCGKSHTLMFKIMPSTIHILPRQLFTHFPTSMTASECAFYKFNTSLTRVYTILRSPKSQKKYKSRNTSAFTDDMRGIKSQSKVGIIDIFLNYTSPKGFKVGTVICAFQKHTNENCQCPLILLLRTFAHYWVSQKG